MSAVSFLVPEIKVTWNTSVADCTDRGQLEANQFPRFPDLFKQLANIYLPIYMHQSNPIFETVGYIGPYIYYQLVSGA